MRYLFVSDLARRFGCKPRQISALFYDRRLDDSQCPVIAGRRCIPENYARRVEAALRERGLIPDDFAGEGRHAD